jgi:hypothetical protein
MPKWLILIIVIPLFINLLSDEITAWAPRWLHRLLRRAARRIEDPTLRAEIEREWLAELVAIPGLVWKAGYVLPLVVWGARALNNAHQGGDRSLWLVVREHYTYLNWVWPVRMVAIEFLVTFVGLLGARHIESLLIRMLVVMVVVLVPQRLAIRLMIQPQDLSAELIAHVNAHATWETRVLNRTVLSVHRFAGWLSRVFRRR